MRRRGLIVPALALVAGLAVPAQAAATPVTFPHGTLDYQFTSGHESASTGWSFTGSYHATGDPSGDPPYMRSMTFHNPAGFRFDTDVPDKCTASDAEIALFGPSACPPASRIASGTATGKFMGQVSELPADSFNNTGEQIIVVQSPLVTSISRGKIAPDGAVTFASPTCYPAAPGVSCPVDDVLQLGSAMSGPAYTRTIDGVVRDYMTTPPDCPAAGYWQTAIDFVWADGTKDTAVTRQGC